MASLNKSTIIILLFFYECSLGLERFKFPTVTFEALKSGCFRAYIPAVSGISSFKIVGSASGNEFSGNADIADQNYFTVYLEGKLNIDDTIWYTADIIRNGLHYSNSDLKSSIITELLDIYPSREKFRKFTISNSSLGKLIIGDDFNESAIDENKWTIEKRIPTYAGDDRFEFNSYENLKETLFIKDGILHLKPVVRKNVSGILDLRDGCTSHVNEQCYYKQDLAFILPPVKSARITSKRSFQYGRFEVRAKLPAGDWIVPVIELQASATNVSDELTKIIIAYSRGNLHLCGDGEAGIGSQWSYGGVVLSSDPKQREKLLRRLFSETPYSSDFHNYTLEWNKGKMSFYIDSDLYGDVVTSQGFPDYNESWREDNAPFNKPYFLSLGVLVGGIYDFPDECSSEEKPKPWNNEKSLAVKHFSDARGSWLSTWSEENTALQIDYVKVWAV